jgi:uncharacterized protein YkwD
MGMHTPADQPRRTPASAHALVRGLLLLCCVLPALAIADVAAGINDIRQQGCEGKPGARAALRRTRGLDQVAREWSKGGRLHEAIARTRYRVVDSASIRVEGAKTEGALLQLIATSYCQAVLNPAFTEIGLYERGGGAWIVVATPLALPSDKDAQRISARVLELVNQARAHSRKCGRQLYPKTAPLKFSPVLARAALAHAKDMSAHKFFDHRGSDRSMPADRVTRAGYTWVAVGENIAEGAADAETVVRGWLDSPGHCVNIMGAQYSEMGLAYFTDDAHKGDIYWVQVFGTARQ